MAVHSKKNALNGSLRAMSLCRLQIIILTLILLAAATLRLVYLDQVPPAIHADEAPNAWNAYTLLHTGKDQYGVPWPIFYSRAFGDNRTTTYMYALIPFQFLWGMTTWTTRLPAVVGGILTVWLIFVVGRRLFGAMTGLVAAAMLAVNPWHLQTSRWGHEASLTPLLVMLSIAALLWANLPVGDNVQRAPNPVAAMMAGIVLGVSCYGYAPIRLFLPAFFFIAVLLAWRAWWELLRTPNGGFAIGAFAIAVAATFGPLVWMHLTDPEISERARILGRLWQEADTLPQIVGKVFDRYIAHFGLDFLFLTGDRDPALSPPPGIGLFHWYDLPLMLIGLVMTVRRLKTSRAARLLLVWIMAYPIGDLIFPHVSLHSLRSLPGVCGFVFLAAVGAQEVVNWLWKRRGSEVGIGCGVFALILVFVFNARFLVEFFGEDFYRQKSSEIVYASDILEATQWLRPRLNDVDAVFITGHAAHPDIVTLIGLHYDPRQWFLDRPHATRGPLPDGRFRFAYVYLGYGKIRFLFTEPSVVALKQLSENGRLDSVVLILRPGELGLDRYARPVHEIQNRDGRPTLRIFELNL